MTDTMWAYTRGHETQHLWVGGGHGRHGRRWWTLACSKAYSRYQEELRDEPAKPKCRLCERTRLARAVKKAGVLA